MQELSLNILDIAENSVHADASLIKISLLLDDEFRCKMLCVEDNGRGMSAEMAEKVTDPFCTTRTTRKVGLGLPFLKMITEMTEGAFALESTLGKGTKVTACFTAAHIDLAPLGDIASTLAVLVQTSPDIDFVYTCTIGENENKQFVFDTREAREILQEVPLSEPSVALFIKEHINENMQALKAST